MKNKKEKNYKEKLQAIYLFVMFKKFVGVDGVVRNLCINKNKRLKKKLFIVYCMRN